VGGTLTYQGNREPLTTDKASGSYGSKLVLMNYFLKIEINFLKLSFLCGWMDYVKEDPVIRYRLTIPRVRHSQGYS